MSLAESNVRHFSPQNGHNLRLDTAIQTTYSTNNYYVLNFLDFVESITPILLQLTFALATSPRIKFPAPACGVPLSRGVASDLWTWSRASSMAAG
jgi:hypothetical protein